MVRWLALSTFTAGVPGLIPGWETKIPQAVQHRQKKREKKKNERKNLTKINKKQPEWERICFKCLYVYN